MIINRTLEPLVDTPHTLIAGATGSGKSVLLNDVLLYLTNKASSFIFFDLKRVELSQYKGTPWEIKYISEPEDVLDGLDGAIAIMESRFARMTGKKSTEDDVWVVVDELADMVQIKGVTERLTRIGRLGRAANIHLLCATQDPSRRTLSAQLMQNFTCTVALRCKSPIESRQIIGVPGAEQLPRYGQALRADAEGITKFSVPFLEESVIIDYLNFSKMWV